MYMQFSDDAEETFSRAIKCLVVLNNALRFFASFFLLWFDHHYKFVFALNEIGWTFSEARAICHSC